MTAIPANIQHVHFIGIAGIGMSALARYFLYEGARVTGYDRDRSDLAIQLEEEGAVIHYTPEIDAIDSKPDIVVYTPAVNESNIELAHFINSSVPVVKRSEMLGHISARTRCIAVAGTHGKTTTSAMIAFVLRRCGLDCTAILGGLVIDLKGNFAYGSTQWLVTEADEYDRSFLRLSPEIAVITSVDPDHLDIYGTYEAMLAAYADYVMCIKPGGVLIVHEEVAQKLVTEKLMQVLLERNIPLVIYGEQAEYMRLVNCAYDADGLRFDVKFHRDSNVRSDIQLAMSGKHNALNATAALTVAAVLQRSSKYGTNVTLHCAADALASFSGISRRFEFVHKSPELVVIDDYAHHPLELQAAIDAAQQHFNGKRITGVFQPHLYSRTRDFHKGFAEALSALDESVLVELYPARELPIEGVSSELIFNAIENERKYLTTKQELTGLLRSLDPEVLLFMGAGDLDRKIPEIVNAILK